MLQKQPTAVGLSQYAERLTAELEVMDQFSDQTNIENLKITEN